MDFGLILPSYRPGSSVEGIEAASATIARLGWHSAFSTDHFLVGTSAREDDYAEIFDALATVVHVAARQPSLRVGVSVIVVPMRNAVELAKELATIDVLSGGRLIVGIGGGWDEAEFESLGLGERFKQRGAYMNEAIAIWRHLWGGGQGPFHGRFHSFDEVRFGPLPVQGAELPVWVGGRDDAALRRAGKLGNGYHSSATGPANYAPRVPVVKAAAVDAGRPEPTFSARFRVAFGEHDVPFFMLSGTPQQMIATLREFAALGVSHVAVDFAETDPDKVVRLIEQFDSEVRAAFL
jgi:alkanesulfonate monooxygenase SsuD/methylene tetrahydromethanopterin reductase-like flavin-dependent oxidoreductase (luciferase family)